LRFLAPALLLGRSLKILTVRFFYEASYFIYFLRTFDIF